MRSTDHVGVSEDKSVPAYGDEKALGHRTSSSDAEIGIIEGAETTKRGLKARHAQMIALGGTIGSYCLSTVHLEQILTAK